MTSSREADAALVIPDLGDVPVDNWAEPWGACPEHSHVPTDEDSGPLP